MRFQGFAIGLTLLLTGGGAWAQDASTLADLRQDLSVLSVELQRLKRELNTSGGSSVAIGGGTLDRINAIESELVRVTNRTEELQHRIDSVVTDGTNRIGDLEFRICEIEPGCDLGSVGQTKPIGGTPPSTAATAPAPVPQPETLPSGGAQLAVGEETDYRRAQEALASGDFQSASDLFAAFRQTYPGSPLEAATFVGEGKALDGLGDTREAARRFLGAYANYPESDAAPEALWRLGAALGSLGSVSEACVTLSEVAMRYPGTPAVEEAEAQKGRLGCQ
ncbi:tol-pal system protein YbgF [Salipiger sp.]|uniref:tol-pal system protein YbgF n=1 Tax=Salipiger sp. TaxID=2078585 RepID=UPI003A97C3E1